MGLEGGFGSVRLGRMLTSSYLAVSRYDAFGDAGIGASLGRGCGTGYTAALRTENAVSPYTSPNFSGFKIGAEYGFGEQQKASDKPLHRHRCYVRQRPSEPGLRLLIA